MGQQVQQSFLRRVELEGLGRPAGELLSASPAPLAMARPQAPPPLSRAVCWAGRVGSLVGSTSGQAAVYPAGLAGLLRAAVAGGGAAVLGVLWLPGPLAAAFLRTASWTLWKVH